METLLGEEIPIAVISAHVIEWLKKQPWFPFAKLDGPTINRIFAGIVAIATAIGLHMAFDPSLNGGTLTITGLNWYSVLHGGWSAVQQYSLQHAYYWMAIQPTKVPPAPAGNTDKVPSIHTV